MPAKTRERGPETRGRTTFYKGIKMRSRLEADFASTLGRHGEIWEYEPFCFAADGVQWLPDFRVSYPGQKTAQYIEVKPAQLMWQGGLASIVGMIDSLLQKMSVAWESEPDAHLLLAFHRYGQRWPDFEAVGAPGRPWMCSDNLSPNVMFEIWQGMGQIAALPTAPESARALRKVAVNAR